MDQQQSLRVDDNKRLLQDYNKLLPQEENKPRQKTIRRLIRDEFKFDRRQQIFLTINTINLILTAYNLVSPINIEGQHSLFYYEDNRETDSKVSRLFDLLAALIFVHLMRFFTSILGYFSLGQKSSHLLTYFMLLTTFCVLCRGIISLIIIINYDTILMTCNTIFLSQPGEDLGKAMAVQFIIVLGVFMILEIFLALISLIQCSRSKEDYAATQTQKDIMMKSYELCLDVAISQFVD